MEKLYVFDPVNYKGSVESTLSDGLVDYSGYLYNNQGPDLTLEQYRERVNNPNLIALTWEEYEAGYLGPHLLSLQKQWEEITQERYDDVFEVLPPMRWTNRGAIETFFLREAYTMDLYSCYLRDKRTGKCYTALRSNKATDEDLRTDFLRFLESKN